MNKLNLLLLILLATNFELGLGTTALPNVIHIGAIIETGDEPLLKALNTIVDRINNDRIILPRSRLEVLAHFVEPGDSFSAAKFVCRMLKSQVWMVFSSKSHSIDWYVRSLASSLHVPHMSVNWDYRSFYLENVNHGSPKQTSLSRASQPNFGTLVHGSNGGFYQDPYGTPETGYRVISPDRTVLPPGEGLSHFTVNLYPEATQLSEAFMGFVESRNWKSFIIIYDRDESLVMLKDLLRVSSRERKRKININVMNFGEFEKMSRMRRMMMTRLKRAKAKRQQVWGRLGQRFREEPELNQEQSSVVYRKLLKRIKKSEHNYILSLSHHRVINILREAYKMNRLTEYDNFLVTSLDMHTYDLREFQHREVIPNITSLSLLSPENQQIENIDYTLYRPSFSTFGHMGQKPSVLESSPVELPNRLTTREALVYDAITLFSRALDDLDRSKPELIVEPFISCNETKRWPLGAYIVDYMKNMQIKGMTGSILFDQYGHRVNFSLDVLQLKQDGLKNVAKWSRKSGVEQNVDFDDALRQILETMKYKELKVSVPPNSRPYLYLKDNHKELEGNEKFDGYGVDLLAEIARVFREEFNSDFKYTLRLVADGQFGKPNKDGEWNGMFGELIRHQADLAIADLTATYVRETAVDFTMPFMNLGIAILFKKPSYPPTELFSFLKPFSDEVWLYLVSSFIGVSMLLWILSRLSPYEWVSPEPCDPEPLELENQFSIGNSLWFTTGLIMQQGSDLAPKAVSTRLLATLWSFFALIMISSYTANLAASLTISQMASTINSVDDLAKQNTILYGCKKDGSTYEFFKNSNDSRFQRMFNAMQANPEVYIDEISDAIERVRKGDYAYLAESSTIEYEVQRKCDLTQVGTWLDSKGYGIATPTDSPYRTPISNAITVLQDRGVLYDLKKRWWETKGGGRCGKVVKISSAQELNIENVGGVFVVLVGGVCISFICGILEFIWKALKVARDERESVGKLIWLEIVRICTGGGSSRPVFTAQQSSNNSGDSQNNSSSQNNVQLDSKPPMTKNSSFQESLFDNGGYLSSPDYAQYLGSNTEPDDSMINPNYHGSSAPLLNLNKSQNRLSGGPNFPSGGNSFPTSPHPYTIY